MENLEPAWYGAGERFQIPDGARHLGHHEGYQFFFTLDQVPDPIVYQLVEGSGDGSGVTSTGSTFSEVVIVGLAVPRQMIERSLASVVRRRQRQA